MTNEGWVVENVDPEGLATQAGVRVGDRPVWVNGQPAETFLERYKKPGLVTSILIGELTVIDEDGQLRAVTLEGSSQTQEGIVTLAVYLITCLIFWTTGFYVFFRRPNNLATLLLCLCGLSFGLILSANYAAERLVPTALWFAVGAPILGPWFLFHFFLVLPEERTWVHHNSLVYAIYILPVVTLIFFPLLGYADGQPLPRFRVLRLLDSGIGFLATVVVAILNYLRATSIRTRQQMKK